MMVLLSTIRIASRSWEISTPKPGHFSIFSFPVVKARWGLGMKVCSTCSEIDGVDTTRVAEQLVANDLMGVQFLAFVCSRCFSLGRITRVTCKTFGERPRLAAN